jgi:Calcineurin-like phosphoesterase
VTPATPPSPRRLRASVWWGLCAAFWLSGPGLSRAPLADVPPPAAAAQTQPAVASATFSLPNRPDSLKFFVLGDFGDGGKEQYELAAQMAKVHAVFPALFIITVGDNIYGSEGPKGFSRKFEIPYKPLLDAGVKFQASLGNHDAREQAFYAPFNMGGKTHYAFKASKQDVKFIALESDYPSPEQREWLQQELSGGEDWMIPFFHHPLYSSGMHGSQVDLRKAMEPMLLESNVTVVFTGHDHFYERILPQQGITHFIVGSGGKLRRGDINKNSGLTAKGFDTDRAFLAVEIDKDELFFSAISRSGSVIDSGSIQRRRKPAR